jgi:hypothetical protein
MNPSLANTALLNNQAIDHFGRGEYPDAVRKLTRSLHIVKLLMGTVRWDDNSDQQQQEQQQDDTMQDDNDETSNNEIVLCSPRDKNTQIDGGGQHDQEMSVDSEAAPQQALHMGLSCRKSAATKDLRQSFIYDTPLHIWPEALSFRAFNHDLLSELSVALMFNLALCHHLHALNSPSSPSEDYSIFEQAIALYELAYEVQMQDDVELSVECTMAIVNNLGHAHKLLGHEGKASKCFSHLLSALLFVQSLSTHDDECDKMGVSASSTEGFIRNVSHLILSKKVAAAA